MLLTFNLSYAVEGRKAAGRFSTTHLVQCDQAPTDAELYAFGPKYIALAKPLMQDSVEFYSTCLSTLAPPGQIKKDKRDHLTRYYLDRGGVALANDKDAAILEVCAQYFKYPMRGTAGAMYLRGVLMEDNLQADAGGEPENLNDAANDRFRAFEAPVLALFRSMGGKGLVMPGPKTDADGNFVSLAAYEASCRQVNKVEFDGFRLLQLTKRNESVEAASIKLMSRKVRLLTRSYNSALADAKNVAANIAPENRELLTELGQNIFRQFSAAERQKIKAPTFIRAYIKA